jgi:hypothetical protein
MELRSRKLRLRVHHLAGEEEASVGWFDVVVLCCVVMVDEESSSLSGEDRECRL